MERMHTPTPYVSHVDFDKSHIILSDNEHHKRRVIAYSLTEPNAEFIVRACNSHYELIEALETAATVIDIIFDRTPIALKRFSGDWYAIELKIKEALAKAKGEQT